jgi:hypothetical protein
VGSQKEEYRKERQKGKDVEEIRKGERERFPIKNYSLKYSTVKTFRVIVF